MSDPLREASRRLQRAWSADGLAELTAGLLFFLPALLEWGKLGLPRQDSAWRLLNTVQMLVIFPGVWIAIWILPRLRNRLFGDRAGIMIPLPAPGGTSKAAIAAIIGAMTAAVLVIMRTATHWTTLTILTTGLGAGFILVQVGRSSGLTRFLVLGPVVALLSVAIAARGADFETSFVAQFGLIGLLLLLAGGATLLRYLHAAPRSAP